MILIECQPTASILYIFLFFFYTEWRQNSTCSIWKCNTTLTKSERLWLALHSVVMFDRHLTQRLLTADLNIASARVSVYIWPTDHITFSYLLQESTNMADDIFCYRMRKYWLEMNLLLTFYNNKALEMCWKTWSSNRAS